MRSAYPYCVIPGRRAAPSPESITPVDAYRSGQWLWIPGSGFAGPGMTQ
jgi:hypothetical protein